MTITVFTKPHCPQCDATKRQFTKLGVNFETVDLSKSPESLEQLKNAGYRKLQWSLLQTHPGVGTAQI